MRRILQFSIFFEKRTLYGQNSLKEQNGCFVGHFIELSKMRAKRLFHAFFCFLLKKTVNHRISPNNHKSLQNMLFYAFPAFSLSNPYTIQNNQEI